MIQATTNTRKQTGSFAADVLTGLSRTPKTLHSKYFYDDRGSQLFEQIMELPEYYPTRSEAWILENHKESCWTSCSPTTGTG